MSFDENNRPKGIRREDLQNCVGCGKGVCHGNQIAVYRIEVTQYIADVNAINRQSGLEQFLGNPFLAHVMGPNEELLRGVQQSAGLFCQDCFLRLGGEAWERINTAARKKQENDDE